MNIPEDEKLPVTVFLPVEYRQRGGYSRTQWWTVCLLKAPDFTLADFTPFALESTSEALGYTRRWDLTIAKLDISGRTLVCAPISLPKSKRWPLLNALYALGWKDCPPIDPSATTRP